MHLSASLTQNLLSAFDFVGSQIATGVQHSRPSLDGAPSDQADAFDLLLKDALDATAPVIVPDAGIAPNPVPKPAAVDAAIRQRVLGTGEWPPATTSPIAARDVATQQAPWVANGAGPSSDDSGAGGDEPIIFKVSRTTSVAAESEVSDATADVARPVAGETDVETAAAQRAAGTQDEPEAVILPFAPVSRSQPGTANSSARASTRRQSPAPASTADLADVQPANVSSTATPQTERNLTGFSVPALQAAMPAESSRAATSTAAFGDTAASRSASSNLTALSSSAPEQSTTEFTSDRSVEVSEIVDEQADSVVTADAQLAVSTEVVRAASLSAKPLEPRVEDHEGSSEIGRSEGDVSEHSSLRLDISHLHIVESAAGAEQELAADDHAPAGHLPPRQTVEVASQASDEVAGTADSSPVVTTFTTPANQESPSDARPAAEPSLVQQLNPGVETWRDSLQEQGTARFAAWLSPPDLGHVWVELTRSAEGITARLKASDDSVQSLLETQEPELRQALDNSGISVTELDLSGRATGDSASQDHRPPPEQHESQELTRPRVSERTPQRSATQRTSAVDVRV